MSLDHESTLEMHDEMNPEAPQESQGGTKASRNRAGQWTILILAAIIVIAAFFRFFGLNFDQNTNQHPDERYIVGKTIALTWPSSLNQFFDVSGSPLNLRAVDAGHPQGDHYPYGSFPVYLVKAAGWLADTVAQPTDTQPKGYFLTDYSGVTHVGRFLAAIFDLITILLVFLIGRRLFSRNTGLVAAALVAFSVTSIQIAHFYASDVFLVTFMMGALYFSIVLMQKPSWYAAAAAGACIGLAVASKVSVVPFALIVVAAVALRAAYRKRTRMLGAEFDDPIGVQPASNRERELSFWGHFLRGMGLAVLAGVFAVLFFSVSEPYVLLVPALSYIGNNGIGSIFTGLAGARDAFLAGPFWGGITEQAAIQSGQADVPYTRQYVGTVPLLYQIQNMVMWGLSPIPGLVAVAGFVVGLWNAFRRRPAEILLMSGALPYFATILTLEAKWMRYMLPLVPIFCILGAAMLMRGIIWMRSRYDARPWLQYSRRLVVRAQRNVFQIITALAVGCAFLWAVAFMNIYSQEHSRIQASRWIYDNIPATISENGQQRPVHTSGEEWDDFVPLGVAPTATEAGHSNGDYQPNAVNYRMYEDLAPEDEFNYIKGQLQQTDYIVIASNRLYGSLRHEPWRYPVQNEFYQLLYAGKLGFEIEHTSLVTPQLFGINFNDQSADESFTVYDHPRVDIFKKTSTLTDEQLHILFSNSLSRPPQYFSRDRHGLGPDGKPIADDNMSLQYDTPISQLGDLNDFQWNPLAQPNTQWIGLVLWLVLAELLGLIALPIVFLIARRLPDKGYPIAKTLGPVLLAWGIWVLSSAHLVPFTVWGIVLVLLALVGLSFVCWRLGGREAIREYWATRRRLIVYYEILFLVAFAIMLYIKMLYPDLWGPYFGGERPMEFGFLNSVLRSPWMPPADPFFSQGVVNYYYYGQFVMAVMMKLIGVDSALGVNFAMPLLFALIFTTGASIVYNIVAWARSHRVASGEVKHVSGTAMAFGVLAGVLMVLIGNIQGAYQLLLISNPSLGAQLIDFARTHGFAEQAMLSPLTSFDFWGPSRLISHTINEFPYWSFLYGDFHPHVIDMPFTLAAVVLAMNLAFAGRYAWGQVGPRFMDKVRASLSWLWGQGWSGVLAFGVLAVLLGTLFATNSWDFPTYAGIAAAGALVALLLSNVKQPGAAPEEAPATDAARATWPDRIALWATTIISVGGLALGGLLAALPFLLSFKNVLKLEIRPLIDGAPLTDAPQTLMHRTTLAEYLVVWAIFVFISLSYLVVRLWAFPWRASVDSLVALFARSGGQKAPSTQRAAQPSAAFSLVPRGGGLSPALAGASAGGDARTYAFASDTRDTMEPRPNPVNELSEPSGDAGNGVDHEQGDGSAVALDTAPSVAEPTEPGQGETQQDFNYDPFTGEPLWTNREATATPAADSPGGWITAAHEHSLAMPVEVVSQTQPGVIPLWAGLGLLAITAGLTALQLATGQTLLALLVALIGGIAATTLSTSRSAGALFTGVLLVSALLVSLGVEVVYLADHLRGGDSYRMNTVFKFYIQVWLLYGVGCAAAVYYIIFGVRESKYETREEPAPSADVPEEQTAEPFLAYAAANAAHNELADGSSTNGAEPVYSATEENGFAPPVAYAAATEPEVSAPYDGNGTHEPVITQQLDNWLVWSEEAAHAPIAPPEPEPAVDAFWLAEDEPEPSELKSEDNNAIPAAAAVAAVQPASAPRLTEVEVTPSRRWSGLRVAATTAWAVLFALFFLGSAVFTFYGTPARAAQRFAVNPPFGTLDGRAYMQTGVYGPVNNQGGDGANGIAVSPVLKYDLEGITWLNTHVPGLRVIFEGPYEYYRDGGMRVAANTGLPMVVGGLHQEEQRYDWQVGNRRGEANEFLTTADPQIALTLISKYNMDYIYLGQLEQSRAGQAGLAKFDQMEKAGLLKRVCCSQPPSGILGTIIYEVVRNDKVQPEKVVGAPVQGSGVAGISFTPLPTPSPSPQPTPPTDDPALKALIAASSADPTNIDKRQALVEWYRQHSYFVDAARELETMVSQRPQDIAIRHALGDAYQAAGQPDKALQAWKDAVEIDPNNPAAHNKLGTGYLDRHNYDQAITEFSAAVADDPNFNEADFHLGEAYDGKGQHDQAVKAYQQAIDAYNNAPADRKPGMQSWADEARKRIGK